MPQNIYCPSCNKQFDTETNAWRCTCGSPLQLDFQPRLGKNWINEEESGLWRYRQALPLAAGASEIRLGESVTPLLTMEIAGIPVRVKCDHLLPTGSFKDRGAAVLISHVRERKIAEVIEDSSGNAGAAIAAYCARAGIGSRIFVPADTSEAKLIQIRSTGARLEKVPGSRGDAALAAAAAAQHAFYASHVWNPYFLHGTKTFAYELCEQLSWQAPDFLCLPVGNGSLLLGVHLGFSELLHAGAIRRVPRFLAVQASACSPLWERWLGQTVSAPAPTLAEGIAVADPPRSAEILAAVRQTDGAFLTVSEVEIEKALRRMGHRGLFIEPTAAVAFAALEAHLAGERSTPAVATLISGNGLKATGEIGHLFIRD